MHIRDAQAADAEAITEIYNHAVLHTTAIWNDKTVTAENRRAWMLDRRASGYPLLVAVDDENEVIGYATFGDWRAWDGYRHTVEHSVYVRDGQQGRGVGSALLQRIIEAARRLGKHVMVAGIESENVGSIRLHERFGFSTVGQLSQVGTKFGRWLDLTFMQLALDDQAASTSQSQATPLR